MSDLTDTVKKIKPVQWAMIAGAGLGLGLLLRLRKKSAPVAAVEDTGFDASDYSGTGQTGYFGGNAAMVNPNAPGDTPTVPVAVTPPLAAGLTQNGVLPAAPTPPRPPVVATVPKPTPAASQNPSVVATQPAIRQPASTPAAAPVASQGMYFGMLANPGALNAYLRAGGLIAGPNDQGLSSLAQIKADLQARVNNGQLPSSVLAGL